MNVLANDTDANGDTLTITGTPTATNGTVVKNGNNTLTFTPTSGFSGTAVVTYTISDGNGGNATSTWTITVDTLPNTPPTAVSMTAPATLTAGSLTAGQTVGTLNCVDAESGNNCTYTTSDTRFTIVGNTLKLSASGSSLTAGTYIVSVTAKDPQLAAFTGNISVTVDVPPNTPPVANPDTSTTAYNTPVTMNVLANDTDANGDTLTITGTPTATNGTVVKNGNNTLTFTPTSGFSGTAVVTYTISDGNGGNATSTWTITVDTLPNTPPTAVSMTAPATLTAGSLTAGQTVGTLNCVDAESGNNCTYTTSDTRFTIVGNTLKLSASGSSLTAGTYIVSVTAKDPQLAAFTGNISVTVDAAANILPVPTFTGFTTDASLSMNYSGQLTATDANGDTLTYALQTAPSTGTLTINPNGSFTFTGSVMPGSYSFVYTVKDAGTPVAKTATITINDVAPAGSATISPLTL